MNFEEMKKFILWLELMKTICSKVHRVAEVASTISKFTEFPNDAYRSDIVQSIEELITDIKEILESLKTL